MEHYRIEIEEKIDSHWQSSFEGWTLEIGSHSSILTGAVADQAALHGILTRIRDLNITIISIDRIDSKEGGQE